MYSMKLQETINIKKYKNKKSVLDSISNILDNMKHEEVLNFNIKFEKTIKDLTFNGTVKQNLMEIFKLQTFGLTVDEILRISKTNKMNKSTVTRELYRLKNSGIIFCNKQKQWGLK